MNITTDSVSQEILAYVKAKGVQAGLDNNGAAQAGFDLLEIKAAAEQRTTKMLLDSGLADRPQEETENYVFFYYCQQALSGVKSRYPAISDFEAFAWAHDTLDEGQMPPAVIAAYAPDGETVTFDIPAAPDKGLEAVQVEGRATKKAAN